MSSPEFETSLLSTIFELRKVVEGMHAIMKKMEERMDSGIWVPASAFMPTSDPVPNIVVPMGNLPKSPVEETPDRHHNSVVSMSTMSNSPVEPLPAIEVPAVSLDVDSGNYPAYQQANETSWPYLYPPTSPDEPTPVVVLPDEKVVTPPESPPAIIPRKRGRKANTPLFIAPTPPPKEPTIQPPTRPPIMFPNVHGTATATVIPAGSSDALPVMGVFDPLYMKIATNIRAQFTVSLTQVCVDYGITIQRARAILDALEKAAIIINVTPASETNVWKAVYQVVVEDKNSQESQVPPFGLDDPYLKEAIALVQSMRSCSYASLMARFGGMPERIGGLLDAMTLLGVIGNMETMNGQYPILSYSSMSHMSLQSIKGMLAGTAAVAEAKADQPPAPPPPATPAWAAPLPPIPIAAVMAPAAPTSAAELVVTPLTHDDLRPLLAKINRDLSAVIGAPSARERIKSLIARYASRGDALANVPVDKLAELQQALLTENLGG